MKSNFLSPRYNLSEEQSFEEIKEILDNNKHYYNKAQILCVALKKEQEWHNLLCKIKIFPKGFQQEEHSNLIYEKINFLAQCENINNLLDFFKELKNGIIPIANEQIIVDKNTYFNEAMGFQNQGNGNLPFPGYLYCSKKSATNSCIPSEHLLSANLPFYPDAGMAIKEWAKLSDFDGSQDYRLNRISLFLPECRAYFKKIEYSSAKNTLEINIIKNDSNINLALKGIYSDAYINKQLDIKIKPDSDKLEIVFDEKQIPYGIELYLIDDKDNLYDYHKEDRYRLEGKQRVLLEAIEKDKEDIIKKAMSSGENEQIEFKPYIKKGDSKINEIIKTVIAFANTKGGCLIMGINDNIELIGIDKAILKDGSLEAIKNNKGIDEAISEYIIYIKKQISDNLNIEIDYKIDPFQISGLQLVLIKINKGSQELYANCRTKEIYVRKGSNNARPDPDSELPQLMAKKDGTKQN